MAPLLASDTIPSRQINRVSQQKGNVGLYVHIPFCHAKCHFCDFATFVGQEARVDPYLEALDKEMSFYDGTSVDTLFLGGGTPTVLSPAQIDRLFSSLRKHFSLESLQEASIEANPESSTHQVLSAFKRNGINRISFGLQTTQKNLLESLNRQHSFEDFHHAYTLAGELGFTNINIDLMYGLPQQSQQDWEETLKAIVKFSPEHISAYGLKVEEGTKLKKQDVQPDEDEEAIFYLTASRLLRDAGYTHYEISNFSKPGYESRHNLKYWKNQETLGLGVSSSSYWEGRRFKNSSSLTVYLSRLSEMKSPCEEESRLGSSESIREDTMLALRLKEGVPFESLPPLSSNVFGKFLEGGHARISEGHYQLTPEGWLLSNQLFQHLV